MPLPTLPLSWYSSAIPITSASKIIIVFAFLMSMPVSIILVHTKTSISPAINEDRVSSICFSFICPFTVSTLMPFTSLSIFSFTSCICEIRLQTTYTCPFLATSLSIASLIISSLFIYTKVLTGILSSGGCVIKLKSLAPDIAICIVRGIGVALSVSTSTFWRSLRIFSF